MEHTTKAFDAVVIGASEPNEAAFILFKEQPVEVLSTLTFQKDKMLNCRFASRTAAPVLWRR